MASRDTIHGTDANARQGNTKRIYVIGLAVAFLLGLIPGWYFAHTASNERDGARESLTYYRMVDESSAAALYAARGQYETARQEASSLFTHIRSLRENSDRLNASQRETVESILQQRDDVITLLARSDGAARDRLLTIEYQLRQAFKEKL